MSSEHPEPTNAPLEKLTERPHPLTPVIRGWLVLVAILFAVGREFLPGRDNGGFELPAIRWIVLGIGAVVLLAAVAGFFSWYFTRFVIDDEELRIETGAVFKNSKRISFERLQSIDVIQPFAARIFGLAELRLEVGAGDSTVKLRFLTRQRATRLRDYLLARAQGERATVADHEDTPAASALTDARADDIVLVQVTPLRLALGLLLSTEWLISVIILLAVLITTMAFDVTLYALPGLLPLALGVASLVGRRVIAQFNFTLAQTGRGLRITRGLTNLTSQSIPLDRIQGLRFSQPMLWRATGWYRVDVDVLGYGTNTDGENKSDASSMLLPVGDLAQVRQVLHRALPEVDLDAIELHPSPRRARWLRPFDGWTLRVGHDQHVIMTQHGWPGRTRNVVPHGKTQSVRLEQGPWQRRLRLASVHVDTTKGPVNLVAAHLDPAMARELALSQLDRARVARTAARTAPKAPEDATRNEDEVLAAFGIPGATPIGSGGESRVFALPAAATPGGTDGAQRDAEGDTQAGGEPSVLRLYHHAHEAPVEMTDHLRWLYGSWAEVDLGFAIPQIRDAGQTAGRFWTVDRRMPGGDLSGWLATGDTETRRQGLRAYLAAARAMARLPLPRPGFGRLLGPDPRPYPTLAALYDAQLAHGLAHTRDRLRTDLPDFDGLLDALRAELATRDCTPALVHGDFCPPNVFVSDTQSGPVITGVGDFSPHTLGADPWLDLVGAIIFLELESYPEAGADAAWLTEVAVEAEGEELRHWIGVYRRFYACYFSDDASIYPWCLAQFA